MGLICSGLKLIPCFDLPKRYWLNPSSRLPVGGSRLIVGGAETAPRSCFADAQTGTCGSAASVAEHELSSTQEVG
jgi:hypothetical protein